MRNLKYFNLLIASCIGFVFFACNSSKKEDPPIIKEKSFTNIFTNDIHRDSLTTIYAKTNGKNTEGIRIAVSEISEQNNYFLVGDKNFIIVTKYVNDGKKFNPVKTDTLLINEFTYTDIDKSNVITDSIDHEEYLFLTTKEAFKGQAVTEKTLTFFLLNLNTLSINTLTYEGESTRNCYDCIDGSFKENKALLAKPHLRNRLFQYANKSKWVFNPQGEEKKITHFKNYEKKWNKDNNADNALANGYNGIPNKIYSTYYKENIFQLDGDQQLIENNRFKISNYFRGNILAFDKEKQQYFPVFIESCITGCNKKIKFLSENTIEVLYDENSTNDVFKINLDQIIFK